MRKRPNSLYAALLVFAATPLLYAGAGASVFYPVNSTFYRMLDLNGRERMFERSVVDRAILFGEGDWEGKFRGREVTLTSGDLKDPAKGTFYTFKDGLLASWTQDGVAKPVPEASEDSLKQLETYPTEATIKAFVDEAEKKSDIWHGGERLRLFSRNPNVSSIVIGMLALALVALVAFFKCWAMRMACGALALAGLGGIFATDSRSGLLAFVVGIAVQIGVALIRRRRFWILGIGSFVCIAAGVLLLVLGPRGRFTSELFKQDELRADINRNFPTMIADSPDGVGAGNSGAVYDIWYRNSEFKRTVRTLVGSHQTLLVERSTVGRVLYLAAWLLLLAGLMRLALRTGHALPLSLVCAFFFAGFFNPIYEEAVAWAIPVLALLAAIGLTIRFRREVVSRRFVLCSLIGAVIVAGGVLMTLSWMGSRNRGSVHLRVRPNCVIVSHKEAEPETWIVNDEFALGGWTYTGQEILTHYEAFEDLPSLALVETLDNLPKSVDRLVLAGRSVEEYVKRWNDPAQRATLCHPKALLLLSPSVDPRTLPQELVSSVRIRAVVGSLAAPKLGLVRDALPTWTRLTPGALVYIPGWITLAQTF